MISHKEWFIAKHGNVPSFTASVRRQEKHYGRPFPVRREWPGTVAAVTFFAVFFYISILLIVRAIAG